MPLSECFKMWTSACISKNEGRIYHNNGASSDYTHVTKCKHVKTSANLNGKIHIKLNFLDAKYNRKIYSLPRSVRTSLLHRSVSLLLCLSPNLQHGPPSVRLFDSIKLLGTTERTKQCDRSVK